PKFLCREKSAFARQSQRDDERETKERDGVFGFHRHTGENSEPNPIARIVGVDRAYDAPDARHPKQRLERVHRQPMMHDEMNWDGDDRESGQNLRERASAEFARDFSG